MVRQKNRRSLGLPLFDFNKTSKRAVRFNRKVIKYGGAAIAKSHGRFFTVRTFTRSREVEND